MPQPRDEDLESGATAAAAAERKKYPPRRWRGRAAEEGGGGGGPAPALGVRAEGVLHPGPPVSAHGGRLRRGLPRAPRPVLLRVRVPAARWPVLIAVILSPLVVLWPMFKYREKHPVNLLLLGLFTLCCSLMMAVTVSTTIGKVVLQAAILTAAAVIGLTLFTFWAAKKGYDFTFWLPFLSSTLNVLLVYLIIQIFVPLVSVGMTIFGCIATVVFSGFIIYDTNLLLKRYTYDEYVVAAISLYLDIINLFMAQISLSSQ